MSHYLFVKLSIAAAVRFFVLFLLLVNTAAQAEAPALLLAKTYNNTVNLNDYWVSEKLDGVRAYWDGNQLISRQGNPFNPPAWFIADFPAYPLDGELWMGRNSFDLVSGIVRRLTPDDESWRNIEYRIFDLPLRDSDLTFDQRLARLRSLINQADLPHLQMVKQFKVADETALMKELDRVVELGGEGLMLHRGQSLYRAARSDDLLKLKTYEDAEAVVIAHLPGKGKYQGMMGALLVEIEGKRRFKIGTGFSDEDRADPPAIGALITYKYFGRTNSGLPRFASFLRVREQGL
jgi:DNA ligase-1